MKAIVVFLIVFIATVHLVNARDTLENKLSCVDQTALNRCTLTNITQNAVYNVSSKTVEFVNFTKKRRISYLDAIEKDLLHQYWEEQEKPCLLQLLKIITNVQNSTLWATWIWDSMQYPFGQLYGSRNHLGNYDQCLDLPWTGRPVLLTKYCLAEIQLSEVDPGITNVDLVEPAQKYIQFKTKHGLIFNHLTWGICAPVICKSESIAKFADAMFKSTHLGQLTSQYNVSVNSAHCHVANELQVQGLMYIFLSLVTILVLTTMLCTWYASFKGADSKSISSFTKAFNLKTNVQWLMKVEDKSMRSVPALRLIFNFFVASGHMWLTKNILGVINAGELDKKLDKPTQCILFNMDMIVDAYFMISGLLLTKNIMEKSKKSFHPFIIIAKRYIRLTCSLLLILLVLPIVLLSGDSGPLVKKYLLPEFDAWASNWWKNILMIGNYGDTSKISYAVLWSLACDFHLFVIAILIFWVYRKNRRAGIWAYIMCVTASMVIPVIYGYMYDSGAVTSFNFRVSGDYRKYLIGEPTYVRTHLRAGPYFVGVAIGYVMAMFQPSKYKNVMSKKSSVLAFFLFLASFVSLNYLSGVYHGRSYGPLEGALFSVMRRNVFAALIGFLIFIWEYGTLPLIESILSWSGLQPLSKLSYGVYLTHLMFTLRFVTRSRVPPRSDAVDDIYSTFSMMATTLLISFLMWLFWEAPMINLFDIIFKRFVGTNLQNANVKINGELNKASAVCEDHVIGEELKKLN